MVELYEETDVSNKNLWIFRKVNIYAEEFRHYNNGEKSYSDYYEQYCESAARDFAEERVEFYEDLINQSVE